MSLIQYVFVVNPVVAVHAKIAKIVVVVVATKMDANVNVNAIQKKIRAVVIAVKVAAVDAAVEVPQKVLVVVAILNLNMIKGVI